MRTVNFSVIIALEPSAMRTRRAFFLELQLGLGGRQCATARVSTVEATGGSLEIDGMAAGTAGDFSSELWMSCQPGLQAPQVTGALEKTVTRVSFDVELTTDCSRSDAMTFSMHDDLGRYLPTSAPGAPGLLASVAWDKEGNFTAEGFIGSGANEDVSAFGFWGRVVAA